MAPISRLPLQSCWASEEEYVNSLLDFAASNDLFRNLCGGIHVLDFLTREPPIYYTILPTEWRQWIEKVHIDDWLDLLLREDLERVSKIIQPGDEARGADPWRGYTCPPQTLVAYIRSIRRYSLRRDVCETNSVDRNIPRYLAVGMKPKKLHEVANFASYVHNLSTEIESIRGTPVTDIVDFGSGQNYLGRTLASPPYNQHVIAIESKHHNINGARDMDVHAKLSKKVKTMRNKKEYKKQLQAGVFSSTFPNKIKSNVKDLPEEEDTNTSAAEISGQQSAIKRGRVTYIEHELEDGNLEHILRNSDSLLRVSNSSSEACTDEPPQKPRSDNSQHTRVSHSTGEANLPPNPISSMVVSLHSCGNLVHHGLQALILNPSVSAVAMIGCCYNLMTERLGPATYKLPLLRSYHPRLQSTSEAFDPHGFPMSQKFELFEHKLGRGLRLNITARMMAVQAPYNWGPEESQVFFTRHFYRALLQKILLDLGVVKQPADPNSIVDGSLGGIDANGTPLIVGSLRKSCFTSFNAYARGALSRLVENPHYGQAVAVGTANLTDDMIAAYEKEFDYAKKHLSIIWSFMAFSAGVVESLIATDRWLFLREQDSVETCWVEPVFEYAQSPRNLAVVGIKKSGHCN
ncbi:MAG: hypothetical protein Q9160_001926 [Pyrenula sp. 1 TL-2023]